jgi:ArsR family transcriptional regulator
LKCITILSATNAARLLRSRHPFLRFQKVLKSVAQSALSNTSRHLNRLKSVGIIKREKRSQWVYYKLNDRFIEENKLLYDFLKKKLAENPRCLEDIERLNNDAAIGLACDKLT